MKRTIGRVFTRILGFLQQHRKPVWCILAILVLFNVTDIIWPIGHHITYSTIVESREGKILHVFLSPDEKWRMFTKLNEITPTLKQAFIQKEDKYFYWHPGINPVAIVRAMFYNVNSGKRSSGASTITMQVVRLLEKRPRTFSSKIIEMLRALQIEWHLSKTEILQLYLNLVPYGGNIEGVKSASMIYLGKTPKQLSLAEAVALSIIPNRPTSLRPGKNNTAIEQQRNKWLLRWKRNGAFPGNAINDALSEPFNAYRRPLPRLAPHLCRKLSRTYPGTPIIRSNIQAELQAETEVLVRNYINTLQHSNIHNAAALILDNSSRKVIAYVGSNDFSDILHGGQVDGVSAIRSPGSTLKPLIYAMAIDRGICTPRTTLTDVPVNFSGYAPENYDETYRGIVTVEQALSQSLNVPAVKILQQCGLPYFLEILEKAGFKDIVRKKKILGLSVALGGCGVTLEEMAGAYAALASGGRWSALSYIPEDDQHDKKYNKLVSAASAWMVTNILRTISRPDIPKQTEYATSLPQIAWKTGTSYGRRDAWSIGYNNKYTVAVWVGNFSGEGVPELTGAEIATPLMTKIFNRADNKLKGTWNKQPIGIDVRNVCQASGKVPGAACTDLVVDYYIPGISSNTACEHQTEVWTDRGKTISYCTTCKPVEEAMLNYYPNYPAELIAWYDSRGIPYDKPPQHNPSCNRIMQDNEPRITRPIDGLTYYFKDEEDTLMLQCQAAVDAEKVFWYVNNKFMASAPPAQPVYIQPQKGELRISCVDDKGRTTKVSVWIESM